jgi:ribosomal protein L22
VGKNANEVVQLVKLRLRKSASFVGNTLSSAIDNPAYKDVNAETLTVKEGSVEQGVDFKRFIPASRDSIHLIRKRMSHEKIILKSSLG